MVICIGYHMIPEELYWISHNVIERYLISSASPLDQVSAIKVGTYRRRTVLYHDYKELTDLVSWLDHGFIMGCPGVRYYDVAITLMS